MTHYLGTLVVLTGLAMLVPAAIGLAFDEMRSVVSFVFGAGLCLAIGSVLRICRARRLDRRRALLLTGLGWVVVAFAASLPLWLSGEFSHHADALFDAVSALTTTGATLADDIDHSGHATCVWRALLTLAGGQAVIVTAMYFAHSGEGTNDLLGAGSRREGADGQSRAASLTRGIFTVVASYLVVGIVVVFGLLLLKGFEPATSALEAFVLVANAISTGGFVPHSSSLAYYHSTALEGTMAVLMVLGSLNFGIYAYVMRGSFAKALKNTELRSYALWLAFVVAAVTALLTRTGIYTSLEGLWSNGTFTAISAVTTAGMQVIPPEQYGFALGENILVMLSLATLFGACSHSSGGGIKAARIMIVLRRIKFAIMGCLLPQSAHVRVKYEHFGTKSLTPSGSMSAMTILILYIIAAALGSMLFIAHGNDSIQSVLEAVSFVSNCGMSAGITTPDMGLDLKIAAILLMWMGRLEFVAVFAAVVGLAISAKPDNLTQGVRERALRAKKRTTRGGVAWRKRKEQPPRGTLHSLVAVLLVASLAGAGVWGWSAAASSGVPAAQATSAETTSAGPVPDGSQTSGLEEGLVPASEVAALDDKAEYRSVEIADLLGATEGLDGKSVQLSGEAVGNAIQAQAGYVWVNIKQARASIGVCMSEEDAAQLSAFGSYDMVGDTATVQGVFHLACEEHGGRLDVHVDTVVVDSPGYSQAHGWSEELLYAGAALAGFGLIVSLVVFWLRRRSAAAVEVRLWR